jgi:hypothetical protein
MSFKSPQNPQHNRKGTNRTDLTYILKAPNRIPETRCDDAGIHFAIFSDAGHLTAIMKWCNFFIAYFHVHEMLK